MCATCGCGEETGHFHGDHDGQHSHAGHEHSHAGHDHHGHHDHAHGHHAHGHHARGEHAHHDHAHHDHAHGDHAHHDRAHGDHAHHDHAHGDHAHHDHAHHDHARPEAADRARVIALEHAILDKNDRIAALNRAFLRGRRVLALNLVSSPGSGKTAILERTIGALGGEVAIAVLEGDQATDNDAERIRAAGAEALQINTGAGCHLDADMVRRALDRMELAAESALMIENVGNLVCPALFDLGEHAKVVVCSVTEGEDKPIKYPHMFRASRLMLLNKIDLLPHLDFDVERCLALARAVNPELEVIELSAKSGEGFDRWLDWIRERWAGARALRGVGAR